MDVTFGKQSARYLKPVALCVLVIGSAAMGYMLHPFAEDPGRLIRGFREFIRIIPYPFAVFVLMISVGSLALIPINVLLIAAALVFPGWKGFFCGLLGALGASILEYGVGRFFINAEFLEKKLGAKFVSIRHRISENGLAAMTFLSLVPVAPHIVNNLVAGVCRVKLVHLLIGTAIGFVPGLLVINILGRSVRKFIASPSYLTAGLVLAVLLAIILITRLIRPYIIRKHAEHDSSVQRLR